MCHIYLGLLACAHPFHSLIHHCLQTESVVALEQTHQALVNVIVSFCWIILHRFFFRITATQDAVCYWKTCRLWVKLRLMSRHLAPNQWIKSLWKVYLLNKAAVCSEQSVSESWSQEARRRGLERWVKLSLVLLRSYQAWSFCPHTFSNLDECSLYGSKKKLGR